MTDTPTPLTDARERETERTANSLLGAKRHAHYGWKHARALERRLHELERAIEISIDRMEGCGGALTGLRAALAQAAREGK